MAALAALAAALAWTAPAPAQGPGKYAGTYRIEGWEAMERQGMYHFLYLHPAGGFLLAGEWRDRESSRATGSWEGSRERIELTGTVQVRTNRGSWRVPFARSLRVELDANGLRLIPIPEKNRFGMLGWPNAFRYYRALPTPNIPGADLPSGEDELLELIRSTPPAAP
ncbi:MAG: hypothetical protein HY423_06755 [Candidatus Lambdaproteobacteria bacterium]|nr:hypothetical protein [Candidatus Lambdaproteobacteria bacterium]